SYASSQTFLNPDLRDPCSLISEYSACRNLTDRLPAVFRLLQEIVHDSTQLDLSFIGLLETFNKILCQSKFLSDMLQSPSVDLATAVNLVEALLDTLQQYRDENFFEDMWKEVEEMAVKCQVSFEKVEKRQQVLSSRLCGSVFTSSTGARKENLGDKEAFKRHIFYPVIDSFMGELHRRFSKRNCAIMHGIQALHLKSSTFLQEEPLFSFAEIFDSNIEDLKHELYQTKRVLERKGKNQMTSLIEFVVFLEPFKEVFHELFRLCKIAIVTPVSSAACERSFSALKLIKNHLRTTMGDERLSHLGVLIVVFVLSVFTVVRLKGVVYSLYNLILSFLAV
uniref:HAT C-terminal dimerisation domain-containing protein n=1 Tax=Sinocyclocheilus anshuiensis TaxID=1608454 RepID=A0A671K1Y8_9TELE